jgi:hypothetical protein
VFQTIFATDFTDERRYETDIFTGDDGRQPGLNPFISTRFRSI